MARGPVLTAQIFRDEMSPDVSLESAHQGLDIVAAISPWIRQERDGRPLRLGGGEDYINTDSIAWPRFPAALNIVVTDRQLVEDGDVKRNGSLNTRKLARKDVIAGMAFHYQRVNSRRVALVNPLGMAKPEEITVHETGHLLGLKYEGDELHCQEPCCVMYPSLQRDEQSKRLFCTDCDDQFSQHVDQLRRAKSGRTALSGNTKIF